MKKQKSSADLFNTTAAREPEPEHRHTMNKTAGVKKIEIGKNYRHFIGGLAYAPVKVLRATIGGYEVQSTISGFRYFLEKTQLFN